MDLLSGIGSTADSNSLEMAGTASLQKLEFMYLAGYVIGMVNERHLQRAREHYRNGRWQLALTFYSAARHDALPRDDALTAALCHLKLGALAPARELLAALAEIHPNFWPALYNLALIHEQQGKREETEKLLRRVVKLAPDHAEAWQKLAYCKRFTGNDDPDLTALNTQLHAAANEESRERLHFALAKAYDDLEQPAQAIGHLHAAHRLKAKGQHGFDISGALSRMQAVIDAYPSLPALDVAPGPIFIIGMPRSGSTLLARLLDMHPEVTALGEQTFFNEMIWRILPDYPHGASDLSSAVLAECGARAVRHFRSRAPSLWFCDKFIGNFVYLGIIAQMMPNARFVHLRRDPRDTCLSIYLQDFDRGHPYAHRLDDLGRYWSGYAALMRHWETTARDRLYHLDYELLCTSTGAELMALCAWLGIAYDPAMLDYHQAEAIVSTASQWQVREAVHRRSIGRWRVYAPYLRPLLETLALPGDRDRSQSMPVNRSGAIDHEIRHRTALR